MVPKLWTIGIRMHRMLSKENIAFHLETPGICDCMSGIAKKAATMRPAKRERLLQGEVVQILALRTGVRSGLF